MRSTAAADKWRQVTSSEPCPICGKSDWCRRSPDGATVICRRVDCGPHGPVTEREDKGGGTYWVHHLNGAPQRPYTPPVDTEPDRGDPDTLHRAYAALLKALDLSAAHRDALLGRGLTAETIQRAAYRTLPARGRSDLARKLAEQLGADVCATVPGWYVKRDGDREYPSLAGAAGLVVPCRDAEGRIVALKVRADDPGPDRPRYSYLSSSSRGGPGPGAPVHLPACRGEGGPAEVRLTEGELKADVATALSGLLTVSVPGVSNWRPALPMLHQLGAETVRLAFDADAETNPHVARALARCAAALQADGFRVLLETWPADAGKGIDDLLAAGGTPETKEAEPMPDEEGPAAAADDTGESPVKSQAALLLELTEEVGAEPFRDPEGGFWLAAPMEGHTVALPIGERHGGVSRWLRRLYQARRWKPPSSTAVADVSAMLAAHAEVGQVRPVHVRIARHGQAVYLDLNRPDWRVAEVTAEGWRVVPCPPDLFFRRPLDASPLPDPDPAGDLAALNSILGDRISDGDRIVVAAWLLGTMHPDAPYPVLNLAGEHGSGKSTLARILASLVDPSGANRDPTVGAPKDTDALIVRAVARHVVALDNLSSIPAELSDAICRLSTGGPLSRRRLYTDFEEATVYLRRPVILTAIGNVVVRGDLADRSLTVTIPEMPKGERLKEEHVWEAVDALAGRVLGGLLTAVSAALRHADNVTGELPRMADWAAWCLAAAEGGAVPWTPETFRAALAETREAAADVVLHASPLPDLIDALLDEAGDSLTATAAELLEQLAARADPTTKARKSWPADATRLSGDLRKLAPTMRESLGIDMQQRKTNGRKLWSIARVTAVQATLFGPEEAGSLSSSDSDPVATLATLSDPASDPAQTRSLSDIPTGRVARVAKQPFPSVARQREVEAGGEEGVSREVRGESATLATLPTETDPFAPEPDEADPQGEDW